MRTKKMKKNRYELRYDRRVNDLDNIEKKRSRKLKQILSLKEKMEKSE